MIHAIQVCIAVTRQKHCSCTDPLTHRSHRWNLYSLPSQLRVLIQPVYSKLHQCQRNCVFPVCHGGPRCSHPARALPVLPCSLLVSVCVRQGMLFAHPVALRGNRNFLLAKTEKTILTHWSPRMISSSVILQPSVLSLSVFPPALRR